MVDVLLSEGVDRFSPTQRIDTPFPRPLTILGTVTALVAGATRSRCSTHAARRRLGDVEPDDPRRRPRRHDSEHILRHHHPFCSVGTL